MSFDDPYNQNNEIIKHHNLQIESIVELIIGQWHKK